MWIWITLLLLSPLVPRPVDITIDGSYGWELKTFTGTYGSDNRDEFTSTVESMIKPWVAADYLRRTPHPTAGRLDQLRRMVVESDDAATEDVYRAGGSDAVIERMVTVCRMGNTQLRHAWWSYTTMTPDDAVRLGACLSDGRAAGPTWTPWLLQQMHSVHNGRWGIIDALPPDMAGFTAIKNGWTRHGDGWAINCLAIGPGFILAVMVRLPAERSLDYGAGVCAAVTRRLLRSPHRVMFL